LTTTTTPICTGDREAARISVCGGSGCVALGAHEVIEALERGADGAGTPLEIDSRPCVVGCRGFCSQGPLVYLPPLDVLYCRVRREDVDDILNHTLGRSEVIERLLFSDPSSGRRYRGTADNPFFANQDRQVLSRCGVVDPEDVDHAVALGAYDALKRALFDLDPGKIIDLVKRSGLQERGGVGFPVGLKWAVVADTPGEIRYVVGNGEAGDPGPTADRTLLEGDPHGIVEGMAIAGYAVGAREGRLFLRSEHALAVDRAERAVARARQRGFLGSRILGSAFDFSIEICENAGASMGGEETSLLNAIQGRRGVARPRPPFPAVSGLWGCPTLINGLETLANIPLIVAPERLGVGVRPARTKVVSVSGAVSRPGVAEVPLGTSLAEIVGGLAGGDINDGVLGVHLGGPGGVSLSPSQFDATVDFGSLRSHEANLGSGSIVVLGHNSCPVALARFLVSFCAEESCGTCPPCRIGTSAVLNLLDRISSGEAEASDLDQLERLCLHIRLTSLCELGRNAAGSVIAGLRNFRENYESHLSGRGCPTGTCE
jgi:NADH:ubiquinone oxidoreductase subunit F (NADH-binding)/(2Fe-2S) ferredoxin